MKKTLVVGINLHGEIPLDKDANPETRRLDNKFIIKLDAVAPGVPNISTFENYNNLSEITRELVKSNDWINQPMKSDRLFNRKYKRKMKDFVISIKNRFLEENKENIKGVENLYLKKKKVHEPIEHEQNFVYNKDNLYTISTVNKGDKVNNKLFLKFTSDELDQLGIDEDDLEGEGFNKILIYNLDEETPIDVFDLLGPEFTQITLFNLIDLLTGMGAENIIFIDMSCSIFTSDNSLTKRTIRTARRQIMKTLKLVSGKKIENLKSEKYGGKTKKIKHIKSRTFKVYPRICIRKECLDTNLR
jgi:hypothetical protein